MWTEIEIVITAWYGDECKEVRLRQSLGIGNNYSFRLYIDGRDGGEFLQRGGRWIVPEYLTSDDILILSDLIEEAFAYNRLNLTWKVPIGDVYQKVYLFEKSRGRFVLYIDREGYEISQGEMWKENGLWTGRFGFGGWNYISGMDVMILGDIIEQAKTTPAQSPPQYPPEV